MKPTLDSQSFRALQDALFDHYLCVIVKSVAAHFAIDCRLLINREEDHKNGSNKIAEARFLCFRLAKQFTGVSDLQIGRFFQRGHSVINWGLRRCDDLASIDPAYRQAIADLETHLRKIFNVQSK